MGDLDDQNHIAGPVGPVQPDPPYVSRGGLKLRAALDAFGIDPTGWWCVDLGCSTGGFTDCLLRAGAARVVAVDTAYGELAWPVRQDERVGVMERSNALHAEPPVYVRTRGGVDLAVIDLGWTKQERAIPAAVRWVRGGGLIVTLIKPHYEAGPTELGDGGVLDPERAAKVAERVRTELCDFGRVEGVVKSPILGGAKRRQKKSRGGGNIEWLLALRVPAGEAGPPRTAVGLD